MRCVITAALAATILASGAGGLPRGSAEPPARTSVREHECRFQWVDPGTWTPREERLTTDCVLARWPVPGGSATFRSIIACESGWNRFAYNPAPYLGLGQHSARYWPGRVRTYTPARWTLRPRWTNSRTQIVVTARMMRAQGLGPWSCA